MQVNQIQRCSEGQPVAELEVESVRQKSIVGRKKVPRKSAGSSSHNSLLSPTDVKAKNTGQQVFKL